MENSFYKWKQLWEGVFHIQDLFSDYMYLVVGEEKAALIDTGMGFPGLRQLVERLTDKPVMVLNTHGHPADGVQAYEDMYEEMADAMGVDKTKKLPVNFDISDKKFLEKYFEILHHPYEKWAWISGGSTGSRAEIQK